MLKSRRQDIYIRSQYPQISYSLQSGKNGPFTVEKSEGHHPNQMIKVNVTSYGIEWHDVPSEVRYWEGYRISYLASQSKNPYSESNHKESGNCRLRNILLIHQPILFKKKKVSVMNDKEKAENLL